MDFGRAQAKSLVNIAGVKSLPARAVEEARLYVSASLLRILQTCATNRVNNAPPPTVKLDRLSRRFGTRWALRAVTLEVQPGEIVGVIGHNGSGKSTLLRVISTALRPSVGDGWIYGHHLVREAVTVRRHIGFLAHAPGLYEDLTATENLIFAARMFGIAEDGIEGVLERVGLAHARAERVRGFSAGMQRRLALARLILGAPRVLLLDEPYNNFDPQGIELVNDVIQDVANAGGSALVVLHDQRQGERVLDRVIELNRGALVVNPADVQPLTFATPSGLPA
ncbi:MAG TPA: heme ABC exporter ATP-binding protein CcmA [Gemmatimonadaceae bacterium]|nr:heme ABC exporter ATP-binding protein CcmA [Gemmatimonadaceae bacterium]